jgi:hypothetical protein
MSFSNGAIQCMDQVRKGAAGHQSAFGGSSRRRAVDASGARRGTKRTSLLAYLVSSRLRSDRWPAGDPEMWKAVGAFGDCDNSPSKEQILANHDHAVFSTFFNRAFAKRPAEELYDLAKDPFQTRNVADQAEYAKAKTKLQTARDRWMRDPGDPRAGGGGDLFDFYPCLGDAKRRPTQAGKNTGLR